MKYAILFESQTGNTALVAQSLRTALPAEGCAAFGPVTSQLPEVDLVFVGFWTDRGRCPAATAALLASLSDKKVALFGTAGFGGDPAYFSGILARVAESLPQSCTLLGGWMCQGKMPASVGARYQALAEQDPSAPQPRVMLQNFRSALSHPDDTDLSAAAEWAAEMLALA